MNGKLKLFLQNIQDVYADSVRLTLLITDWNGVPLTNISNISSFVERLLDQYSFFDQLATITKESSSLSSLHSIIIEPLFWNSYIGMKGFLIPIHVSGKIQGYIWAFAFIEENMVTSLKQKLFQCKSKGREGIHLFSEIPILTIHQVQVKKQQLEKMAVVCEEMFDALNKSMRISKFEILLNTVRNNNSLQLDELLRSLQSIENFDFIGKADIAHNGIKIHTYLGPNQAEICGGILERYQPLFKRAETSRNLEYWEYVGYDLNFSFLIKKGIQTTAFFCYPMVINNKVEAFLFGGFLTANTISPDTRLMIAFTGRLLEFTERTKLLQSKVDLYLMKMAMLTEINKVMGKIREVNELLFTVTDISRSIVPSHFAAVFLKAGDSHINNYDSKMKDELVNDYCQIVSEQYFQKEKETVLRATTIVEKFNTVVIVCPIQTNDELLGVLLVSLREPSELKVAEAYLANLTSICAMALVNKQLPFNPNNLHNNELIEQLTARELDVFKLVVKGLSNKEIANHLFISTHTVKNHITNIFNKLGVTDRTQMIAMIYQLNYQIGNGH